MQSRAIFLDRDGTINVEKNYLHKIEEWEWTPHAPEAIKLINDAGYLAVVVSNQAGIARGYYSQQDVLQLHQQVDVLLAKYGARIDAYYFCPHHTDIGIIRDCNCRKPNAGMFIQAQEDWDIDFENSYMIGDKLIDAEAAKKVGITPIIVKTGYGKEASAECANSVKSYSNLFEAINDVLNNKAKNAV